MSEPTIDDGLGLFFGRINAQIIELFAQTLSRLVETGALSREDVDAIIDAADKPTFDATVAEDETFNLASVLRLRLTQPETDPSD